MLARGRRALHGSLSFIRASVRHIQQFLGHTKLSTTQKYLAVIPSKLKKGHAAAHPAERNTKPQDTHRRRPQRSRWNPAPLRIEGSKILCSMDGEYEPFERCTCGHTYDNHVEGGRCGERDGCDEFHDPNHRVLQRLDEIEDLIQYLTRKVTDLAEKKRRP